MWTPDVYEGSPLPVTFFSIVPKLAGITAVMRISMIFLGGEGLFSTSIIGLLVVVSALTMTVGNVTAIGQQSVKKRMLAYSSISHAGFMLMGVVVLGQDGVSAISYYSMVYVFMTLVAFYVVGFVSDHYGNDDFNRFNGLIKRNPLMAIF